jgi:uncharacterized protein (TIGR02680 family)
VTEPSRHAASATTVRARLPQPTRTRWQPLRLGLVNLYRFDDETFAFEDGRLLLRGNNGTGKSRILALTVPFLLDGRIEPHRVEPDGDPAKRMEWNLLLGKHDDRLGYTWIEFGRVDDEGTARFVTLGIGLRATAGRGAPKRWHLVTDRRVGDDLSLIAETGQALARDRLIEVIDDRGQVVDKAADYRRLVDRELFGLGEHRYEALVDLLVQLRRPQLSRQLDESLLSDALSEALPPLPPAVVADVADAFRALDDDRETLEGYQAALAATTSFLTSYRTYGAIASRRRATAVTQANSRYEKLRADLRDAERRRDEAAGEVARLEAHRDELEDAERAAAVEVRTLEASPEMEAARDLDRARARADELAALAESRAGDLQRAEEEHTYREGERERADHDADETRQEVLEVAERTTSCAGDAGLVRPHAVATARLELPDSRDRAAIAAARDELDREVGRIRQSAEHLVQLGREVQVAAAALADARSRLDERSSELDRAQDAVGAADETLASARRDTADAWRRWAGTLVVLAPPGAEEVADAIDGWDGTGIGPVTRAADAASTAARDALQRVRADLEVDRRAVEEDRTRLAAERAAVAEGVHLPPPVPHTRAPDARATRAGAPLWRLIDLRDGIEAEAAAGYEAALEAAGLLDAWLAPDGTLLDADDTVLVPGTVTARADGGLGRVLAPATAPGDEQAQMVPEEQVTAALGRIGAHPDGEVWVASDGRWQLGPLHGRWHKAEVEHLGHAARERARQRRLDDLDRLLRDLDARDEELVLGLGEVDARLRAAEEERAGAPSEDPLRQAVYARAASAAEAQHHRARVTAAETEVHDHHGRFDRAERVRDDAALDLGMPDRADDPAALLADAQRYHQHLAELWAALRVHGDRLRALDSATVERDRAAAERARRDEQARAATRDAADAATTRDTLQDAVGRSAAEIVAKVEAARARQAELVGRRRTVAEDREHHLLARQRAETEADATTRQLEQQTAARTEEIERFRRLVAAGFLEVAAVGTDADLPTADAVWAPDPAVRTARRINDTLGEVAAADADWERVQRSLHGHYTTLEQALLPHGLQPSGTFDDDLFVVATSFQGRSSSIPDLHDQLADEVLHRQSLLDAREREVLENHLVGEVATQLHELIRSGESMVAAMNAELATRPTSTGMRLRFSWQPRPDGPEALADARKRLLAADHVWSPTDRQALGAFLQARIREVRDADNAGTWPEHLTAALDYRRWHLFAVEREQDGRWVRLTRRTHGTGSGGEKALALTVPQFAAAAAHYRSADEHAPRLIALDEAFVGIDTDMRAKSLDLLVSFDLDVVMTSEREWACYPTVPAIAIQQLATRAGIDAVGVHRWVWNGRDRLEVVPG